MHQREPVKPDPGTASLPIISQSQDWCNGCISSKKDLGNYNLTDRGVTSIKHFQDSRTWSIKTENVVIIFGGDNKKPVS